MVQICNAIEDHVIKFNQNKRLSHYGSDAMENKGQTRERLEEGVVVKKVLKSLQMII